MILFFIGPVRGTFLKIKKDLAKQFILLIFKKVDFTEETKFEEIRNIWRISMDILNGKSLTAILKDESTSRDQQWYLYVTKIAGRRLSLNLAEVEGGGASST